MYSLSVDLQRHGPVVLERLADAPLEDQLHQRPGVGLQQGDRDRALRDHDGQAGVVEVLDAVHRLVVLDPDQGRQEGELVAQGEDQGGREPDADDPAPGDELRQLVEPVRHALLDEGAEGDGKAWK